MLLQIAELKAFQPASMELILSVHEERYIASLRGTEKAQRPIVLDSSETYATSSTYRDSFQVLVERHSARQRCCHSLQWGR